MDDPIKRPLWAPWRMEYILGPKGGPCVFCVTPDLADADCAARHILYFGERTFVMLNRFPFAAGHLLILPYVHVPDPMALDDETYRELFALVRASSERLSRAVRADGLNIGVNVGTAAGAGIPEHVHVHVVPRWSGDHNFMPVVADTRVMPQTLEATRRHLLPFFADLPSAPRPTPTATTHGAKEGG